MKTKPGMEVSRHANIRVKERVGKKIDPWKLAKNAMEKGLRASECKGYLKEWVDERVALGVVPYIFNNHMFLFSSKEVLITVIPVPGKFNSLIAKLLTAKRAAAA